MLKVGYNDVGITVALHPNFQDRIFMAIADDDESLVWVKNKQIRIDRVNAEVRRAMGQGVFDGTRYWPLLVIVADEDRDPEPVPPEEPAEEDNTGPKGDIGETGAKGDKGDAGEPGLQGETGITGAKGDAGIQGDAGTVGAKGDAGAKGDTGQGFSWESAWSGANTYVLNDVVKGSDDNTYIALGAVPLATDPIDQPANAAFWTLFVPKGTPG